ncbi:MAG: sodium:proton antiporter [Candidatus Marinimicrobia bacterium]|nr:sodium:proton antiporter [Candidatus Neomarinimicrobiota bacterium]
MTLVSIIGFVLIIVGLWGMLTQSNIIKIIIGFSIIDTGIHLLIVSIGYIKGKTAPIIDNSIVKADAVNQVVDPIPSALVLTAIVIGLAVTALMLVYAVNLYQRKQSLDINDFEELKW